MKQRLTRVTFRANSTEVYKEKRMRTRRVIGLLVMIFAIACLLAPATGAEDFTDHRSLHRWKVFEYSHHRPHLHTRHPRFAVEGGLAVDFLETPDTAYLLTSHSYYDGDLLGDMTGKVLTAFIDVNVEPETKFTYYGEPDGCPEPANVRYYFETNTSGRFEETDYWWSTLSPDLDDLRGPGGLLIVFPMSFPSAWVDHKGHPGDFDAAHEEAFKAAVQDVRAIGLSFGGGCGLGNGVGIVPGGGGGYFRLGGFFAAIPPPPLP